MRIVAFFGFLLCFPFYALAEVQAVFDLGSGKIKMQVADVQEMKTTTLYTAAEKIGQGFNNEQSVLSSELQARIVEVIKALKIQAEEFHPVHFKGFATAMFRKDHRGGEVVQNISALTCVQIEVISEEEEGILGFLTIVQERELDPERIVVLDIGSGSFQITCRVNEAYLTYSVPIGRNSMHELVKRKEFSTLEQVLEGIDPGIRRKISLPDSIVIGIGAHARPLLKSKSVYDRDDVEAALSADITDDLDYSDLILAKAIMETLSIPQIRYMGSNAGNTSGFLLRQKGNLRSP